jgi:hypothetical protein
VDRHVPATEQRRAERQPEAGQPQGLALAQHQARRTKQEPDADDGFEQRAE